MRQCEFKKRYDPEMDLHVGKHIYGEGITDIFKAVGSKLFGKTAKSLATKAATKAAETAATKTGEVVGKKAGDKIVELLSKKKTPSKQVEENVESMPKKPVLRKAKKKNELTPQEINEMVNQIIYSE